MKNDPIIHAKASAIVEAIKNEIPDHEENRFNGVQVYGIPMYSIETITEALASIESSEREVLEWFVAHIKKYRGTEYELNIDRYLALKQSKTE